MSGSCRCGGFHLAGERCDDRFGSVPGELANQTHRLDPTPNGKTQARKGDGFPIMIGAMGNRIAGSLRRSEERLQIEIGNRLYSPAHNPASKVIAASAKKAVWRARLPGGA